MQTISKYILTLVALLMTTTGAWATDIYVAGNGSGNWCNGKNWEVDASVNKMTEENGVYSITFNDVPAGDGYEFKFAENGSWDVNYGYASTLAISLNASNYLGNNTNDGPNITFSLSKTADVTISFNLTEKMFMISTNGNKVGDDLLTVTPGSEANTWEFNMVDCSVEVNYVLFPDATLKSIDYIDKSTSFDSFKIAIGLVPKTEDGVFKRVIWKSMYVNRAYWKPLLNMLRLIGIKREDLKPKTLNSLFVHSTGKKIDSNVIKVHKATALIEFNGKKQSIHKHLCDFLEKSGFPSDKLIHNLDE